MVLWLPHSRSFQGEPASLRARCWRLPRRPTIRLDNSDANDSRRDDLGHRGRGVTTEGSLGGASSNRRLTSVVPPRHTAARGDALALGFAIDAIGAIDPRAVIFLTT
jgi:hypothetical protein